MPRAKKEPERCKHFVKNTTKPHRCKNKAGDDGWCARHRSMHKSTGPKTPEGKEKVTQNPRRPGLYSKGWWDEDIARLDEYEEALGSLDEELIDTRIRRNRAVRQQRAILDGLEEDMQVKESRQERDAVVTGPNQQVVSANVKQIHTRRSEVDRLEALIDQYTARIKGLEESRHRFIMERGAGPRQPDEMARAVSQFLRAFEAMEPGPPGDDADGDVGADEDE